MTDYQAEANKILAAVEVVEEKYQAEDEAKNLAERKKWNRASALGWAFDCPRHLCLNRLCPEKEVITPQMRRRFKEGKLQESMLKATLRAAGVKFAADPKPMLEPTYQIKGVPDDMMFIGTLDIPVDYKSCSSAMFREISLMETSNDLLQAKHPWVRHYPTQVLTYDYLCDRPAGMLLFKDKEGGDKHSVVVVKNDKYMGELLAVVNDVNALVKAENPPAAEWKDVCKGCGFVDYDFTPEERVEKVEIIQDEEMIAMLTRRQDLLAAFKEYEDIDERVKVSLKQIDKDKFMVGNFLVQNTKFKKKTFEIPEDVKAQYAKVVELMRTTIKLQEDTF